MWQTADWDPALRFWTLAFDPNLGVWLQTQDVWRISILAAREFARQHVNWRFDNPGGNYYDDTDLTTKGWLDASHLAWKTSFNTIKTEIEELVDLMEDDRDRYLGEINAQADGLAAYYIAFLNIDGERKPWTIELINCGLAIGQLVYMHYKQRFRRARPSTLCPGLVPPFGPPRHPAFPSGHSFLGHFISLLLLEIPEVARVFGEEDTTVTPPVRRQATLAEVMSTTLEFKGPLLWLARRQAKNRERAGLHYRSDSDASRWLAGAIWALLTKTPSAATPPSIAVTIPASELIDCPTLKLVLKMAKAEWAP